jgi:predicted aspartyl protease
MNRIARALALLLVPLTSVAGARDLPQDPDAIPAATAATELDGTQLTLGERSQRLTVPVAVGARGPYDFIIDTGAERTVVSRELAGSLDLVAGAPVTLVSMTGISQVNTVIVPELAIESIGDRHTITAPALGARDLGAVGLLGIDTLSKNMVSIDFETGTMTVRKSERRARASVHRDPEEIVVTAKSLFGQLIVTDAYFGNTRIRVVIDTGSQVSMGNSVLRRRVGGGLKDIRPIELTSVTGGKTMADYTQVPQIKIGDIEFQWLPVAFADVAPFRKFGLEKTPALLLGMDALRNFRRVDIDFPNRQVRFLMPRDSLRAAKPTLSILRDLSNAPAAQTNHN